MPPGKNNHRKGKDLLPSIKQILRILPLPMNAAQVLATYIYIQCKRNVGKPNANSELQPLFQQEINQGYKETCNIIEKLCSKLKITDKMAYQAIRLIEKFCKNKRWLIMSDNYFRVVVTVTNLLNKYYNDKYLWLRSMQSMTGIRDKTLYQCELVMVAAVDFDFYYADSLYHNDKKKIQDFLDKYIPRFIQENKQ